MIVPMKRSIEVLLILLVQCITMFSQPYSSKDNFTGAWETPESWDPTWLSPQSYINGYNISINGFITANGNISFTGSACVLTVHDTLVIKGDLTLDNNNDLTINDGGILIVRGNLTIGNQTRIVSDGYCIITGNLIKGSSINSGSFTSNDNPMKVFIGGSISSVGLTDNNPDYPVLNTVSPATIPYPNSVSAFGNANDLMNDPIYSFFQTTCTTTTPTITAGGPTTFCAGGSVTLNSSTGSTYVWSTGATTASINDTAAGNYTVQVTNADGCMSALSVATIVTVHALPVTPIITAGGPTTFCTGGSVTLTSSEASTYLWSTGATTPAINTATAGSYTVQVTDANGCKSAPAAATITAVNPLPVVNAGTDVVIPNGTSTTIDATVTGTGPFTYSWSPSVKLVNAFTEDPATVNLATTTVYTLTATSATTSCANSDEVTVTISGGPLSSTPSADPATICAGTNVQLHALASGGSGSYTHTWTSTPVGFTSSAANPVVNPAVNTTYHVAVYDGFNTVNSSIAVMVYALPATPTITAGGLTTFCAGGSVMLTSSAGSTYLWSTGATTASINAGTTESFTVQVTNASGCLSGSSAATMVTVNPLPVTPTITAGGPTTFCDGGSVMLTSSAGSVYLWSTGATTPSINASATDGYTVQVTDAAGCQGAVSVAMIVTVNALPAIPTVAARGPITFCQGDSVTLTASAGSSYLWSTGATTPAIIAATSGSYTVQVTDANGCQSVSSAAATAVANAQPVANAGPDQQLQFVFESLMQAELSPSETGEWSLISGSGNFADIHSPTSRVTELSLGENSFLWKAMNGGCNASEEVIITVNDLFVPTVITPNVDGKNDYFILGEHTGRVELIIFNSWGNIEYATDNYEDDWSGRNKKGEELPGDTYFYVLNFENGNIKKGSVLIIK